MSPNYFPAKIRGTQRARYFLHRVSSRRHKLHARRAKLDVVSDGKDRQLSLELKAIREVYISVNKVALPEKPLNDRDCGIYRV